jgi:hypothetical protein
MKHLLFTLITITALALVLAACVSSEPTASTNTGVLLITDGTADKSYTPDDLKSLASADAAFSGVTYQGVPLTTLLQDAGFDPQAATAVKAIATDGFTVNYGPDLFLLENTLVAYARTDGPLGADDGTFRMVLPDQDGKLNVRMLATLQVVK